jgi:putative ATP-binding cassette transporter
MNPINRRAPEEGVSDERILAVLRAGKLEGVVARVGGLDKPPAEVNWPSTLSAGEQQELAIARLLLMNPRFAFLDRAISGLAPERARQLYQLLAQTSITYISVGEHVNLEEFHDTVLKLHEDGGWEVQPLRKKAEVAW